MSVPCNRVCQAMFFVLWLTSLFCVVASEKRVVRVGYYYRHGFLEQDENEKRSGFGFDYLMAVASHTNWQLQFVHSDKSLAEMITLLEKGEIDLLPGLVQNDYLRSKFNFSTTPIFLCNQSILIKPNRKEYLRDDYSTWKGLRLGVLQGWASNGKFMAWKEDNQVPLILCYYNSEREIEEAFRTDQIDGWLTTSLRQLDQECCLKSFFPDQAYFMVRKEDKQLLEELNAAQSEVDYESPTLRATLAIKYYGHDKPYSPKKREVDFIEKCRREKRVFRALINPQRYPLSYLENGQLKGHQFVHAQKILSHTGLQFEMIPCETTAHYVSLRDSGNYDVLLDSSNSFTRAERYQTSLTNVYLTAPVSTLSFYTGKPATGKFGVVSESNIADALQECEEDCTNMVGFKNWTDMLINLQAGTVDYIYLPTRVCNETMKTMDPHGYTTKLHPTLKLNYTFAISREVPRELLRILNQAIAETTQGELSDSMTGFTYQMDSRQSLKVFLQRYPVESAMILTCVLLLIACLFLLYYLQARRILRFAAIVKKLPLRFLVANQSGKILLHNLDDEQGLGRRKSSIRDFIDPVLADKLSEETKNAFARGGSFFEYRKANKQRFSATCIRLPDDLMNQPAVCCFSQNTTDLLNMKDAAESTSQRLELTLQSIGDAIIVTDADGMVTMVNPVAERLFGMNSSEICGKYLPDVMTLVNHVNGATVPNPLLACLEKRETVGIATHTDLISKDGTKYHISDSVAPIINSNGQLLGAIMNVRDVTQEHIQRDKNKSLSDYLEQIVNFAPFGFFTKYQDGDQFRYDIVNEETVSFLKLPPKALMGKTVFDVEVMEGDAEQFHQMDLETAADNSGKIFTYSVSHQMPSGETRYGLMYRKAYLDAQGKKFILCCIVDTTKMEMQKLELERAMQEAQSADRAKSYFLAVMSHEIRTPLNAVLGLTELLMTGDYSQEEQRTYLQSVSESGKTLLSLINNVLDLSKLEANQMKVNKIAVSLTDFINTIRTIFLIEVQKHGLSLEIDMPENLPVVEMDSNRVQQILVNLVGNALKFTTKGGITVKVRFEQKENSGTLSIGIIDTGIGMDEETIGRIFEPFAQGDETTASRKYGGTGLGLSICKKMAELMDGSIAVESQPGKGSTFTLIMNNLTVVQRVTQNNGAQVKPIEELRTKHILIVDDVQYNLLVLAAMLKKLGILATPVKSAEEALGIIQQVHVDMVLTDLWMPEMNGIEFAKNARSTAQGQKMKIVALTADADAKTNFDLSAFDAVLFKPVTLESLNKLFSKFKCELNA